MLPRGRSLLNGILPLLLLCLAPSGSADEGNPRPWWRSAGSPGDTLRVTPDEGGWSVTWQASPGQRLELPWPTDPMGFPGRYRALVDRGGPGVSSREVGPSGWELSSDGEILLSRPRDTVAAMVALVHGPAGGSFTWTKRKLTDPLRETLPRVTVIAPSEGGAFHLWFADAAPAESLHAAWSRVANRGSAEDLPPSLPALRTLPAQVSPEVLAGGLARGAEVLRRLGLTGVLLESPPPGTGPEGPPGTAMSAIREQGLDVFLSMDPFSYTLRERRRWPIDAVGIPGSLSPRGPSTAWPGSGWPARRALAQRAVRGPAAGAGGFQVPNPAGAPGAPPHLVRIWLESFLLGAGGRPVRIEGGDRQLLMGLPVNHGLPLVREALAPDHAELEAMLTLGWWAPLQGGRRRFDVGPVSLTGAEPGESRLGWMIAVLSGGAFLVHADSWLLSADALAMLTAALPPLGRAARSPSLFRTGGDTESGPVRFVLDGVNRELRSVLNFGEQPAVSTSRAGLADGATAGPPEVLVYDPRFDQVMGRFSRLESLPLTVAARDARWVSVVGDPGRPVLLGTRAHWSEGIGELRRESWDDSRRELLLEMQRVAGAEGVLVIACPAPPVTYRLEGGEAREPGAFREERGVGVYRLPVAWTGPVFRVRLSFGEDASTP